MPVTCAPSDDHHMTHVVSRIAGGALSLSEYTTHSTISVSKQEARFHMIKRIEAIVYGRVQGVAFRYATYNQATQLHLTGWVMNRPDGSVRVVAEGAEQHLAILAAWLHDGPAAARVDLVDLDWMDATGEFSQFTIRG